LTDQWGHSTGVVPLLFHWNVKIPSGIPGELQPNSKVTPYSKFTLSRFFANFRDSLISIQIRKYSTHTQHDIIKYIMTMNNFCHSSSGCHIAVSDMAPQSCVREGVVGGWDKHGTGSTY
jgi:hypothetical protein